MTVHNASDFNQALGHAASDKRLEVLRRVGQTGSISQAARDAGISYKAAWQAIETLTNLSGQPLVDRSVGGNGGGGARITPQGQHLLALADELAQARAQVLARHAQGQQGVAFSTGNLGLRTSMRNQLPCKVASVRPVEGSPMVDVQLITPCAQSLLSRVTRESAEVLGLLPGLAVLALCKATAVEIWGATGAADANAVSVPTGHCQLLGSVAEVSPGTGQREVTLTLPCGHLWVGFIAPGLDLNTGQPATGKFAPSALVIGLGG